MGTKLLIEIFVLLSLKKGTRTRGHDATLVKDQCRLDIRKYSFSKRTMHEWNELSPDCINASSVNIFKNNTDKYRSRAGYTQMTNCWTLDKPMVSSSTCHLGVLPGWQSC